MKIVSAHVGTIPISSSIRNAFIDFTKMDCTIIALVSDVFVDGKPLVGYGFNSNGRYNATGILKDRVLPRIMDAPSEDLLDEDGQLSPEKAWDLMMSNEKPGGHGERSVAVGVADMALHDLAAKIAGVPLYRWISDHYGDGNPDKDVFVYAAGGYYAPGKTLEDLQNEMRGFLAKGYNVVKMKIGGADLAEDLRRIEAVIEVLDGDASRLMVDVNGKFDLETALEYGKAIDQYGLFWYEEVGDPLDYALNATLSEHYRNPIASRRKPVLPPGRAEPRPLRRDAPGPRLHPGRPGTELRPDRIPPDPGHARPARLVLTPLHPPRRTPVLPAHRSSPQARWQRVLPGRVPAHRWLHRRRCHRQQPRGSGRSAGDRARR
ncbi:hypothetical protein QFZ23_002318 [Arthrobacter globiformis]|nr:enolase C-terminal domain-like protein [Arthrobacter globiformis]MDQ1058417.1 hypothetical protein [Arthrobacter globiformis]